MELLRQYGTDIIGHVLRLFRFFILNELINEH